MVMGAEMEIRAKVHMSLWYFCAIIHSKHVVLHTAGQPKERNIEETVIPDEICMQMSIFFPSAGNE